MIELAGIQNHDLGIAAFMIGMTLLTGLALFKTPVKTALFADVFTHILMTFFAKSGLCRLVEFLVAFIAIFFFFGMCLDDLAGRHHTPECHPGSRKSKAQHQ